MHGEPKLLMWGALWSLFLTVACPGIGPDLPVYGQVNRPVSGQVSGTGYSAGYGTGSRAGYSAGYGTGYRQASSFVAGIVPGEIETLNSWKTTAKTTLLGNQLLTYLDLSNKSLAYNSTDKASLYRRAYLYGTIGCTQSAIGDLTRAIAVDPYFAAAYCERGICYIDMKDYNRALSDLNRAIQLNPNSGDAVMARGRVWLATGRAQLALADFRWAEQGNMKYSPALPGEYPGNQYDAAGYYIGSCYEAMDRPEEAVKYYKASLKTQTTGQVGFLHRYADQPLDAKWRLSSLERHGY